MNETNNKPCTDIYTEKITTYINVAKRFSEVWLRHSFHSDSEMFQYADDDFYFYRFAISRVEKTKPILLSEILCGVLDRYDVVYEIPDNRANAPFEFIIDTSKERLGYSFEMYYEDDLPADFERYNVQKAYVIRTIRGKENIHIDRENERYKREQKRVQEITIQDFFEEYTTFEEYQEFDRCISGYITELRKILGYQSIKILSNMNLSVRKLFEEGILKDWNYENYKYQVLDVSNPKIQNVIGVKDYNFQNFGMAINEKYIDKGLYRAMLGTESYAESFITSEWLFYSLKEGENFDFTAIVSGYLKSIEQLLYKLVMLNIDNNCVISMRDDAKANVINLKIPVYKMKWNNRLKAYEKSILNKDQILHEKHPYIDFIEKQKEYMDSSIGTFEHFLKINSSIFLHPEQAKVIGDMVSCFRTECRNGFFHTHNLHDWTIVNKTRENAIVLYAVLLGNIKAAIGKSKELGIVAENKFDLICKEIRELKNYTIDFLFKYSDGSEKKMIFDAINNVAEYTSDGIEHYESLAFFEVEDFSMETYEKLDTSEGEKLRTLLTPDNLPVKIQCAENYSDHEVSPKLLKSQA